MKPKYENEIRSEDIQTDRAYGKFPSQKMSLQRCAVCGYQINSPQQVYCLHDDAVWFGDYVRHGGDVPDNAIRMDYAPLLVNELADSD